MEPITWGALGAIVLFIVSVSTFIFKLTKDYDIKTNAKIAAAIDSYRLEAEARIAPIVLEIGYLKQTSVRQEDLTELKSDVKTLVARLEDMRMLILTLRDSRQ